MGKRKIEIKRIGDRDKRYVTFTKRRGGLFKKAADACKRYDSEIAIIVFSPVGRLYTFGHSSVDSVLDRFLIHNKLNDDQRQQQQCSSSTRTISDRFLINNRLNEQQQQQQQQQQHSSLTRTIKEEKDDDHDQVVLNHMVIKREEDSHHYNYDHKKKMKDEDEVTTTSTNLYLRDGDGYSWPSEEDWNSINFDPNFIHRSS